MFNLTKRLTKTFNSIVAFSCVTAPYTTLMLGSIIIYQQIDQLVTTNESHMSAIVMIHLWVINTMVQFWAHGNRKITAAWRKRNHIAYSRHIIDYATQVIIAEENEK